MEKHISFDRDELKKKLQAGLTDSELLEDDNELDNEEPTFDLAAVGSSYTIGKFDVFVSMGNLMALSFIESPFVSEGLEEGQTISYEDSVEALYVIIKGFEVCKPIMKIQQRVADVLKLSKIAKDNMPFMEKMLDRVELISKARTNFTCDAVKFYEDNLVNEDFEEIMAQFQHMLGDAVLALQDLPADDKVSAEGSEDKKK